MSDLFWLSEAQVDRLRPFFPKSRGKPRVDDRRVLSGIIYIQRNGLMWKHAPKDYGPPKTLYNRWKRWSRMGVFATIMTEPVPPEAHDLVADLDAALVQQVFDVPQRQRETDVEHHSQADDLVARLEVAEGAGFGHAARLGGTPARLKQNSSDSTPAGDPAQSNPCQKKHS